MTSITPEFAEILGLLCSEGSHIIAYSNYYSKTEKRNRVNAKSERIEFYNKDKRLILHYQDLLLKEFDYKTKITKHGKINIGNRRIINFIIEQTELGHLKWKIPQSVLTGDQIILASFVRGYFDGDGTASKSLRMFSCNQQGLIQVSKLLNKLGIPSNWQTPMLKNKRKPLYVLHISQKDRERFLNLINPVSKGVKTSCPSMGYAEVGQKRNF